MFLQPFNNTKMSQIMEFFSPLFSHYSMVVSSIKIGPRTGKCSLIQLSQTLYFFAGYFERLRPGYAYQVD